MIHNPRHPDPNHIVRTDSTHPAHADLRKTLVLLKIETKNAPIHFVVEGLSHWPEDPDQPMLDCERYFYEEHTCPTNFIRIPMISHEGDHDPHGVFDFVDAVWMMDDYNEDDADEYLVKVFPQLRGHHG